jgi:hypothetical protein
MVSKPPRPFRSWCKTGSGKGNPLLGLDMHKKTQRLVFRQRQKDIFNERTCLYRSYRSLVLEGDDEDVEIKAVIEATGFYYVTIKIVESRVHNAMVVYRCRQTDDGVTKNDRMTRSC